MRLDKWASVLNYIYWLTVLIIYYKRDLRRFKNVLKHMFFAIFSFLTFGFIAFWFLSFRFVFFDSDSELQECYIIISNSLVTFILVAIDMLWTRSEFRRQYFIMSFALIVLYFTFYYIFLMTEENDIYQNAVITKENGLTQLWWILILFLWIAVTLLMMWTKTHLKLKLESKLHPDKTTINWKECVYKNGDLQIRQTLSRIPSNNLLSKTSSKNTDENSHNVSDKDLALNSPMNRTTGKFVSSSKESKKFASKNESFNNLKI